MSSRGFKEHAEEILDSLGLKYSEQPDEGIDDGYLIESITRLPGFQLQVEKLAKDRLRNLGYAIPRQWTLPYDNPDFLKDVKELITFRSASETREDILGMVRGEYQELGAHQEPAAGLIFQRLLEKNRNHFDALKEKMESGGDEETERAARLEYALCQSAAHRIARLCGLKQSPIAKPGMEGMRDAPLRARAASLLTELGLDGQAFMEAGLEPRWVMAKIEQVVMHTMNALGYDAIGIEFHYRNAGFMDRVHDLLAPQGMPFGKAALTLPGEDAEAALEAKLEQLRDHFTHMVEIVKSGREPTGPEGAIAHIYGVVRDSLEAARRFAPHARVKEASHALIPLLETSIRQQDGKGLLPKKSGNGNGKDR